MSATSTASAALSAMPSVGPSSFHKFPRLAVSLITECIRTMVTGRIYNGKGVAGKRSL